MPTSMEQPVVSRPVKQPDLLSSLSFPALLYQWCCFQFVVLRGAEKCRQPTFFVPTEHNHGRSFQDCLASMLRANTIAQDEAVGQP